MAAGKRAQTSNKRDVTVLKTHSRLEHLTQSHQAQRALIGQEPVSLHIITAKFATKKNNINLAPTNDAKEKIEDFYKQLQAVLDRGRNKDITVLMGDVNGKIGSDNTGHEEIM